MLALEELRKADLLDDETPVREISDVTRRAMLVRLGGVAAALIPAIATLVPASVSAQTSCFRDCVPCTRDEQCCSGKCKNNGNTLCGDIQGGCP